MATFAELGISFPLFEAPVDQAASFVGLGLCDGCGREHQYFHEDVDVTCVGNCGACGARNEQTFGQRTRGGDWRCSGCGEIIPFRDLEKLEKTSRVCFECVKAGDLMFPKDTEFGLVSLENAETGITAGVPGLTTDQFEVVVLEENWTGSDHPTEQDVWSGARIPNEELWELLRTPRFFGWQDEKWLFCCRRAMVYVGHWLDVVKYVRPEDPDALFKLVYATLDDDYNLTAKDFESHDPEMYVFRCRECHRLRAYMDAS